MRRFRYWPLQDELDRLYEQWPARERPLFPPSAVDEFPSLSARLGGEHHAPASGADYSGAGATVPNNSRQE